MLLVMPSYGHDRDLATADTLRRLRGAAMRFGLVAGLDTGSWLMARAGLLDGYRATSHWDVLSSLEEEFPEVDVVPDRFVIDRDRASCGGATATLDLMLELIGRRHGTALALDVAALFLYGGGAARAAHMPVLPHRTLREAAALMRRHLEEPLDDRRHRLVAGPVAAAAGGAVPDHADLTPVQLYRRVRLAEARRRILETTQSVAEIAGRCGYGGPRGHDARLPGRVRHDAADLRRNARRTREIRCHGGSARYSVGTE
jgi:transcriptional regulator GlxA family with amidase domain